MKMRLKKKQGLRTGEASKMLGISIRSAERLFERRILTGSKNPITGRMVIDRDSIEALAKEGMKAWPPRGRPRMTSKSSSGSGPR
jgi:hypothetical protein